MIFQLIFIYFLTFFLSLKHLKWVQSFYKQFMFFGNSHFSLWSSLSLLWQSYWNNQYSSTIKHTIQFIMEFLASRQILIASCLQGVTWQFHFFKDIIITKLKPALVRSNIYFSYINDKILALAFSNVLFISILTLTLLCLPPYCIVLIKSVNFKLIQLKYLIMVKWN